MKRLALLAIFTILSLGLFYSTALAAVINPIDPVTPPVLVICGNGIVQTGEQCDDGNTLNTDACLNTCLTATCGDGFIRAGVEQCDDSNTVSGDGCSSTCTTESGFVFQPINIEPIDLGSLNFNTSQGPSENPPGGDITPTFSGLIIEGVISALNMVLTGALQIEGTLDVRGNSKFASMLLSGNLAMHGSAQIYTDNVHTTDITASGDITSSYGTVGSFYTKWASGAVTTSGEHYYALAECYPGDELTGCSGYFAHDSANDRFLGAYIGTLLGGVTANGEQCIAKGTDGGGADDTIYAFARCFDPAGTRSGKYN